MAHIAKGRTNVELREQFILADGVSQSMTPFKSKSPVRSDATIPTTGPITKVCIDNGWKRFSVLCFLLLRIRYECIDCNVIPNPLEVIITYRLSSF